MSHFNFNFSHCEGPGEGSGRPAASVLQPGVRRLSPWGLAAPVLSGGGSPWFSEKFPQVLLMISY